MKMPVNASITHGFGGLMINIKYDLNTIDEKRALIKNKLFERSANIKSEDFNRISEEDLYILYELYDEIFLNGWFKQNFKGNIKFILSRQLTRSAGNTKTGKNIAQLKPEDIKFEVKISVNHLINFNKVDRRKYAGGIEAHSVTDGLMLVFEHELCHVIEFLLCCKSSCRKKPFKDLIFNLFGQTESTHELVGADELNALKFGLKPGDNVCFKYNGKRMNGFIQRINKRATVMCPDKNGRYIDKSGRRYKKYYASPESLLKSD